MSTRIEERFAALAKSRRKALITYVMAGDPDIAATERIIAELPKAGADIIEIGIPFSDPMADGPVIQAAARRALSAGAKLKAVLGMVKTLRSQDKTTPFILMGYYNSVYYYGIQAFCTEAAGAGVDGIILVDLPPEEEEEFVHIATPKGIRLIRLIAPTTDDRRLAMLSRSAGGFLYYISIAGITGTKSADVKPLQARIAHLKSKTRLPVAVGFGIKTPQQAADISKFSDGVVVGSALVEMLAKKSITAALEFVRSLRMAMDQSI